MRAPAVTHLCDAARTAASTEAQRRAWSAIAAMNGAGLDTGLDSAQERAINADGP